MKKLIEIAVLYATVLPLLLGICAVGYWGYENVIIPDIQSRSKGGLGKELSEEMKVDRRDLPRTMAKILHFSIDSLGKYYYILPYIQNELQTIDVGLKIDKRTKRSSFLHTDGFYYPTYPKKDSTGRLIQHYKTPDGVEWPAQIH